MMNFVDEKIVQLEEEIFAKFGETLELMRQYQAGSFGNMSRQRYA